MDTRGIIIFMERIREMPIRARGNIVERGWRGAKGEGITEFSAIFDIIQSNSNILYFIERISDIISNGDCSHNTAITSGRHSAFAEVLETVDREGSILEINGEDNLK